MTLRVRIDLQCQWTKLIEWVGTSPFHVCQPHPCAGQGDDPQTISLPLPPKTSSPLILPTKSRFQTLFPAPRAAPAGLRIIRLQADAADLRSFPLLVPGMVTNVCNYPFVPTKSPLCPASQYGKYHNSPSLVLCTCCFDNVHRFHRHLGVLAHVSRFQIKGCRPSPLKPMINGSDAVFPLQRRGRRGMIGMIL